jgi:hypothetical protein
LTKDARRPSIDLERRRRPLVDILCLSMLEIGGGVFAQSPTIHSEFQVSAYTTFDQQRPGVAIDGNGSFVIVWQGFSALGDEDIFVGRFSSAGSPTGAELRVNDYTPGSQGGPVVAMDSDGGFVVVWYGRGQHGTPSDVLARRFSSAGEKLADEFQVNLYTFRNQARPALAMEDDGDFVIVWEGDYQDGSYEGVFGRCFNADGSPKGPEFQVSAYTLKQQLSPSIAVEGDGDFVVAWDSVLQDGDSLGVFARRFTDAGTALTDEFQVSTITQSGQRYSALISESDGDFVVIWMARYQDGSEYGVFARRFDAAGIAMAAEFQVNAFTSSHQARAQAAVAADGNFVVVWESGLQDGSYSGIFAQRFSSSGSRIGPELQINSHTLGSQWRSVVAMRGDADFVVAWESLGQDRSGDGVFARSFSGPSIIDVDGNGAVEPLTDAILILRYTFGFRGGLLINGVVDLAGCTRCTAEEIEAFLAVL